MVQPDGKAHGTGASWRGTEAARINRRKPIPRSILAPVPGSGGPL